MYITFNTDDKAHFRGFKAKFISEQKGKWFVFQLFLYMMTATYFSVLGSDYQC